MVEDTMAVAGSAATDDLAELDFVPITDEEAINLDDRTYLFGVHLDAVRPT